ncbi:MAG: DUF2071 domain-containing protein [Blastocatellia bacterium]
MDLQIQMLVRDLMFINYAVDVDRLRPLVPGELDLDLVTAAGRRPLALVSAVPFTVADVRSTVLPLPRLSFNQINYRTYVRAGDGAGAYFFDMRVNSRLVTTATGFLRLPISYDDIEIMTAPAPDLAGVGGVDESTYDPAPHTLRCAVTSSGPQGLAADITIGGRQESVGPREQAVSPDFITERPVAYVNVGDSLFKAEVRHPRMDALSSHVESVRAPALVSLGLLNMDEAMRPHSILYVREILMDTNVPSPKK